MPRSDTGLEAAPHEIRELLAESHHWDFDIIKLERLTERRSTLYTSLVHSHWSRNVEAWLSLVESFIVYIFIALFMP